MSEFFESEGPRNLPLETPYTPPKKGEEKGSSKNPFEKKESFNPDREDSQFPIQTNKNNSGNTDDDDDDTKKNRKDPVINDKQKIDRIK